MMKPLSLLLLLALGITSIDAASTSENVRGVQTKLKDEEFYFGEVDGALSNDLSTALTRYQIRHGLQITGNLNEETSKSLGVAPEVIASSSPVPPTSDTWRRLRKSDPQFLSKLSDRHNRSAAAGVSHERPGTGSATPPPSTSPSVRQETQTAQPPADSPTRVLVPAQSGNNSMYLLSPERVRDYVGAFVLAGLDPQVGAELEFFADRVRYYDNGIVDRQKIAADLKHYAARWPERRFWLAGDVQVDVRPDSRLRATFPLRFELGNGSKRSSGKVQKSLLLEVIGEELQIVAVNERRAR